MEHRQPERNLELERLVFFSDAVVAIAITLLALDIKISKATAGQLSFADLLLSWKKFASFFLSFLMIAVFWQIHHQFFFYIKRIDQKLMFFNLCWLLFIVILPFATTLISDNFSNEVGTFVYASSIFLISIFQNAIWDYATSKPEYLKTHLTESTNREYRVACNLSILNSLVAMALSFVSPILALFILLSRTIMFRRSAINYINAQARKLERINSKKIS